MSADCGVVGGSVLLRAVTGELVVSEKVGVTVSPLGLL